MKNKLFLCFVLLLTIFLFSCNSFNEEELVSNSSSYVIVCLNSESRTVLPNMTLDYDKLRNISLECYDSEGRSKNLAYWSDYESMGDGKVEIKPDVYTFILRASMNNQSYIGYIYDEEITNSSIKKLSFILTNRDSDSTGNINVKLSYPSDSAVNKVTATLYYINGNTVYGNENLIIDSNTVSYQKTVSSGDYILRFHFYNNMNVLLGMYSEVVCVVDGYDSSAERTIETINNSNSITYELGGGEFASGTTLISSFSALTPTFLLPSSDKIIKQGYYFGGWYTSSDFQDNTLINEIQKGTDSSLTVYAKWIPRKSYTITFNLNGGNGEVLSPISYYEDSDVLLPTPTGVTKSGHVFESWNTKADGTGTSYRINELININQTITLYLVWKEGIQVEGFSYNNIKSVIQSLQSNTVDNPYYIKILDDSIETINGNTNKLIPCLTVYAILDFSSCKKLSQFGGFELFENPEQTKLVNILLPETIEYVWGTLPPSYKGKFYITKTLEGYFSGNNITGYEAASDNPYYKSISGTLYDKTGKELVAYPAGGNKNCIIPEGVISIGRDAFKNNPSLESVSLPSTLKVIDYYSFMGCTNLKNISFENSLQRIAANAFSGCTSLQTIEIPDTVNVIEDKAFENCSSLQTVKLPASLNEINGELFQNCRSLTGTINLPGGVTKVLLDAFDGTDIREINIPKSTKYIQCGDIWGYSNGVGARVTVIEKINVDEDNTTFCSVNGVLFTKDMSQLLLYPTGKTDVKYSVPQSVKVIGSFCGNPYIQEIVLPSSLEKLSIGHEVLDYFYQYGWDGFTRCEALKKVNIPSNLKVIPTGAFESCSSLESLTIPEGIEEIEGGAFDGSGLKELIFPASLNKIANNSYGEGGSFPWVYDVPVTTIEFKSTILPELENHVDSLFMSTPNLQKIIVPSSAVDIYTDWNMLGHGIYIPIVGK